MSRKSGKKGALSPSPVRSAFFDSCWDGATTSEDSYFGGKVSRTEKKEGREERKRKGKERKGKKREKKKMEEQRLPRYTLASRAGILERDRTRDTHALPKS